MPKGYVYSASLGKRQKHC